MTKIVNLTEHNITLRSHTGEDTTITPSGIVARVGTIPGYELSMSDLPCYVFTPTEYGDVENLPEREEGTIYIVSSMVAGRVCRKDVFSPGTGPKDGAIRNEKGHIVAVTRLIRSC